MNAVEREILMVFRQVQGRILSKRIYGIIPVMNTVKKISVRLQK
jgi:hypothetical protein